MLGNKGGKICKNVQHVIETRVSSLSFLTHLLIFQRILNVSSWRILSDCRVSGFPNLRAHQNQLERFPEMQILRTHSLDQMNSSLRESSPGISIFSSADHFCKPLACQDQNIWPKTPSMFPQGELDWESAKVRGFRAFLPMFWRSPFQTFPDFLWFVMSGFHK